MDFQRVISKVYLIPAVLLLYVAVFTAAYSFSIEDVDPRTKLGFLAPYHRASWSTDHFNERSIYEEVAIMQPLNGMHRFQSARYGFRRTRVDAVDQDWFNVMEAVQRLAGNCVIEDLSVDFLNHAS